MLAERTAMDLSTISSGLALGADGIWYGGDRAAVSYPEQGHAACFQVEDSSFWFKHRNRCIVSAVRSFPPAGPIFDIGGGNGYVSQGLAEAGFDVVLVEPGASGAMNAKRRGLPTVVCATTESAGFRPRSLAAAGLFDVIEHIDDDRAFLRGLHAQMQPRGRLYVTVPAYATLWSDEDVHAGHYRRHTLTSICKLLDDGGYDVEFASYIFRFLPLPIALLRALPYRLGLRRGAVRGKATARDHGARGGPAVRIVERLLAGELTRLAARRPMRFGGSCLVVAAAR